MRARLVDVRVTLHHQTKLAVLVSKTGDPDDAVWVPKSKCEVYQVSVLEYDLTMERELAAEKGLT